MAGKGSRTHEYTKLNPGGARPVQYIYVHPQLDRALQQAVLERDGYTCGIATLALFGKTPQALPPHERRCRGRLEVHHLRRLEDGGDDGAGNLTTLCKRHHALAHQAIRALVRANSGRRWPPL